jgi:hypothetical protein
MRLGVYLLEDPAEVGVIFEVMNDRGKALSDLEKVKNFLLYTGTRLTVEGHDLGAQVNHAWRNIFERLMAARRGRSRDEDALLRFHWLATQSPDPSTWEGSSGSSRRTFRSSDGAGRAAEHGASGSRCRGSLVLSASWSTGASTRLSRWRSR